MAGRAVPPPQTTTDDVLHKTGRQAETAGPSLEGGAVFAAAPGALRVASPRQIRQLQGMVGNAALQRMLFPAAAETEMVHGEACACPHCKPQRVYTDEPLAPIVQRDADAHAQGCTCPACGGGFDDAPAAPLIQRVWTDSQETEEDEGSETTGGWTDQAQQTEHGGAGGEANGGWTQAGGENSGGNSGETQSGQTEGTGEIMSVQEDFVADDTGGQPDIGLHVAVVEGGQQAGEQAANEAEQEAHAPNIQFVDGGRMGTAPVDFSGRVADDGFPHAFVDGGMTGTTVWAGGGGAGPRGNQGTGTIQSTTNPTYQSRSNGIMSDSEAWVAAATGDLTVTRSWLGANAGNQGNGHYVTDRAAARFNQHEVLHVNSTRSIYNSHLQPMLDRVKAHRADNPSHTTVHSFFQSDAIATLRSTIDWATAVGNFQTDDKAANSPMNTVDTNDLASGTYPVDRGPGTFGGVNYQHRVTMPDEAAPVDPAPGPAPGPVPPGPGPAPGPGPGPVPGPTPAAGTITASALRIRQAPNTASAILGQYPRGTQIQILSQEQGESVNGNTTWNRTDRGYVSDAYVQH
ncbi:MAG: SH3 domain-containing protein [Anaerolineae bacterium]|nr:SH3 domain-containing protein [Anaerolineae bacterium]